MRSGTSVSVPAMNTSSLSESRSNSQTFWSPAGPGSEEHHRDASLKQLAWEGKIPRDADSPLEGAGFELSVPPFIPYERDSLPLVSRIYWRRSADAAIMDAP